MAIRKLRNSWWVDIRYNYTRYRKKSPENSRAGAQAYETVLRTRLANGKSIATDQLSDKQEQLFEKFADSWVETYVVTNNKASEVRRKKYTLKNSLIPFFGKTPINQITTSQVEQFKAKKTKEGLVNKTINNHLTVLGKCLGTAEEWLNLEKIPKIKMLKTPPPENDFLEIKECDLLLEQLQGVWRDIVLTALNTGLRMGELRGLRWKDINWDTKLLTVRHAWCDYKKALVAPKSNRTRCIPLASEVYTNLLARKGWKAGFVFADEKGDRFNDKTLNREIKKACKKAGLRKITCHTLRHTFASRLAMAGAPLGAIQELLGHADIQTTMRYAHLSKSTLKDVIDLLGPETNHGQPVGNTCKDTLENSEHVRASSSDIPLIQAI